MSSTPLHARRSYHQIERMLSAMLTRVLRSALSPALTTQAEVAAAYCDTQGRSVVECGRSPALSASLGAQVRTLLAALPGLPPLAGGDIWVVGGDPTEAAQLDADLQLGGDHLPSGGVDRQTLTLILPVGTGGPASDSPCGYVALRARWPRPPFGGPGETPTEPELPLLADDEQSDLAAMPPAVGPRYAAYQPPPRPASPPRHADQEGLPVAPSTVDEQGLRQLGRRAGMGRQQMTDLLALRAALRHGRQALDSYAATQGSATMAELAQAIHAQAAAQVQAALRALPRGIFAFADSLDDDGCGHADVALRATFFVQDGALSIDLRDSADQTMGPLNCTPPVALAVVREALRRRLVRRQPDACTEFWPQNEGLLAPVTLRLRPGSLLAPLPGAPLALGCDETAARLFDVIGGALSQIDPAHAQAAGAGTRGAVYVCAVGGDDPAPPWCGAGRLLLGGGRGAAADGGAGAPFSPDSDESIEALEARLPLRVTAWSPRSESAGLGIHAGVDGQQRTVQFLRPLHVTLAGERRRRPPYGLAGGGPGLVARDLLLRGSDDRPRRLPGKAVLLLAADDQLISESPGGGGHGDAQRAAFFASLF